MGLAHGSVDSEIQLDMKSEPEVSVRHTDFSEGCVGVVLFPDQQSKKSTTTIMVQPAVSSGITYKYIYSFAILFV